MSITSSNGLDGKDLPSREGTENSDKSRSEKDVPVHDLESDRTHAEPQPNNDTTTEDGDTIVAQWASDDDPSNPLNWPAWKTNFNAGLIAFLSFLMPLTSSICAPGVPEILKEFKSTNSELAAFVVSVYVLGFAFGPLLFAPLSEIYGRVIIYHVCNVGFIAFVVGCALAPNLGALIAFRFLSGVFGSCPLTNGGASIADMIRPERRGAYMGMVSIGPLLGPIIGPIAGSFLAAAKGWRWTFWLIVIIGGFAACVMVVFARETYGPVIIRQKKTGRFFPPSTTDDGFSAAGHLKKAIVRPVKLLVFSPITIVCAFYMAVVYGYLYLMFSSVTEVFERNYHFASNIVGLVFLGLGVGSILGIGVTSTATDRHIKRVMAAGGEVKPESRLRFVPIGGFLLPAGLFLYGWTCEYHVFWFVPIIGLAIVGAANMMIFMSIMLYLIDSFSLYEASALAANAFVRSLGGGLLPLAGLKLFDSLGMGWGNSLLAFLAVAFIPVPFLLIKYGERLRLRYDMKDL